MLKRNRMIAEMVRAAVVLGVGIALAGPAAAGQIYSWRTDDGDVAFTDDVKNVPPRYRDQVEVRESASLGDYERFSSQEPNGTDRYQQQLSERLDYLRALNAHLSEAPVEARDAHGTATLRLNGSDQVISVDRSSDAPVIVERIRVRRTGQIVSRHDTVVRQGDKTLAILRGSQEGELGAAANVIDEDELELYR